MKTFVPNSCLKLNSILYKSQNREANEGIVHCADIEGTDVKPGSTNSFGCRTLCKIPNISPSPERVELLRSHYLRNTASFGLTPNTDITSISLQLKNNEQETLSLGQVFATSATFFYSILNTQNICSSVFRAVSRNFILQLFRFLRANFYCNFYQVLRKM